MASKFLAAVMATLFFIGSSAALTGCNTIEGAGKDVQQGGKAIKDEANEHKN